MISQPVKEPKKLYESNGFCAGLSASWIMYHAKNDSLVNHIQPGSKGPFNRLVVMSAAFLQESLVNCLLYTSPSPRDGLLSRMPSSA